MGKSGQLVSPRLVTPQVCGGFCGLFFRPTPTKSPFVVHNAIIEKRGVNALQLCGTIGSSSPAAFRDKDHEPRDSFEIQLAEHLGWTRIFKGRFGGTRLQFVKLGPSIIRVQSTFFARHYIIGP